VQAVKRFFADTSGATLVEYGILLLIIAAMSVVTIKSIGTKVSKGFDTVNATLP
jgi:Flp pilus assembly pilin Flp